MAFDPSTARLVIKFDPSTAIPFNEEKKQSPLTKESALLNLVKSISPTDYPLGFNIATGLLSRGFPKEQQKTIKDIPFALEGRQPTGTESFGQSIGESLPTIAATSRIPSFTLASKLKNAGKITKGLLNYFGNIGTQGSAFGALDLAQGGSGVEGVELGGGTTALLDPMLALTVGKNPIARATGRLALGAGGGYLASGGSPEGAAAGGALAFGAPGLLRQIGYGKNAGRQIAESVLPQDVSMLRDFPSGERELNTWLGQPQETPTVYGRRLEAASEMKTPLSVGEATGRHDLTGREGRFEYSAEGASQAVQTQREKAKAQKKVIKEFQQSVSDKTLDPGFAIRQGAQEHIEELKQTRSKATEPYYTAAEKEEIPQGEFDKLLEVPRIKDTMHEVLNDKDLSYELGGKQPTGKKMIAMVENRIDNLLEKARSKPYNKDRIEQLEYAKRHVGSDYGDPKVQSVLKEIYQNDPVFQATAMGINSRGMRFLDVVKKRINTAATSMGSSLKGADKYTAGLIQNAAKKITDTTDQYSKNYQTARSIHEQMSPVVNDAENSVIGRLANLKDTNLNTAHKIVFDQSQTNLRVMQKLKQQIMRRNPDAWNAITRQHIDDLIKKGKVDGVSFNQQVLNNENLFKQLQVAVDHNPEALRLLNNMKDGWEDLKRIGKGKSAHYEESRGFKGIRDSMLSIVAMIADQITPSQQAEAIKYLNSPAWEADVLNVANVTKSSAKEKLMTKIFGRVIPSMVLPNVINKNDQ